LGTILTWLILSGMMIAGKKLGIFDSDLTSMLTKLFGLLVFTGGAFIVLAIAFDDFTIWYRQRKYTRNNPIKD
jgi:hypothetical protein